MEIVPTSIPKKKGAALDELMLRKVELKQQIQDQKQLIRSSCQTAFSPTSIISSVFGTFQKSLNLVDGVVIGYKFVRSIRRLIRRFR